MAVEFKAQHTRTSEYLFYPEDILVKPVLNGRHELPDISWLVLSIIRMGQLQPVLVRSDGGVACLAAGHSRWRAIVEINKLSELSWTKKVEWEAENFGYTIPSNKLKVRCCYVKCNEQDGFIANIQENHCRNATSALDDAHNIAQLRKWAKTDEEIAAIYRKDVAWVKRIAKLAEVEPEVQAAVKEGRCKPTAAVAIAKLTAEQQREAVKGKGKVKAPAVQKNGIEVHKPTAREIDAVLIDDAIPTSVKFTINWLRGLCTIEAVKKAIKDNAK